MMVVRTSSDEETVLLPSSPDWIPTLSEECAVCGDTVSSSRLGSPACVSCIVFFRRAVIQGYQYKCFRNEKCLIDYEYRTTCRFCRLQKCYRVGMRTSAVRQHDSYTRKVESSPQPIMRFLIKLQAKQLAEHRNESYAHRRRATSSDVNKVLKWSFSNAIEWASNFEPFRKLSNASQKCVISEYGIAFFLIDQGFRSVRDPCPDFWLLQNGSYIHRDFFHGLSEEIFNVDPEAIENHKNFYELLESSIRNPFENLRIDEFEVAALKTLLLLTPSFPKQGMFVIHEDKISVKRKNCMKELMAYCERKRPGRHEERFGEIVLLIGEIRSAVKAVYNQTKISEIFDSSKFDPYVQSFLLT